MSDGISDTRRTHWLNALDEAFIATHTALSRLSLWELEEEFLKAMHKAALYAKYSSSPTAWEDHQRADTLTGRGLQGWINKDCEEKDDESEEG